MGYGEYVKFVAHNDLVYSDILGDYTGSTEGETAGTLDDWDSQSGYMIHHVKIISSKDCLS